MDSAAISRPQLSLSVSQKLRAWMVLGRISNLPTVWSNCLAGCFLGGWNAPGAIALLCLGSSLLYVGGMFLNDVCDVNFDTQFRPERPIVSGALTWRRATIATVILFSAGLILIATINFRSAAWAVSLTILIVIYDLVHKKIPIAPLLMAGCRFLLYLTAAAAGMVGITPRSVLFASVLGIYVAGLSYVARGESRPAASSTIFWLLLFAPVIAALSLTPSFAPAFWSLPLILCIVGAKKAGREGVGRTVSLLLAGIVLVDLIVVSTSAPMIAICFLLFGVTLWFQRHIPAT
jgi:4-hydroxybenzoate polyprenyltransferase